MNLSSLLYSVGNTLIATAVCLLMAIPIGGFFAVLVSRSNVIGRSLIAMVLASQLAVPLYVFAGGWAAGVGLQGWFRLDYWLGPTGLSWLQSWFGKMLAVSLIHALACIPWVTLILSMGLATCDRNEEETAWLESGWSGLVHRIWRPRLRIWIWVACLWCSMGLLTEMVVSNLYMFRTVAELIYLDVSRDTVSPMTYIMAVLLCSTPILLVGVWLYRRLPQLNQVIVKPLHHYAYPFSLGKSRTWTSIAAWLMLLVLVGLPILNLSVKAGWTPVQAKLQNIELAAEATRAATVGYTWTWNRFQQTVVESLTLFRSEFTWSGILAVCSGSVAIVLSVVLYWLTSTRANASANNNYTASSGRGRLTVHLAMLLLVAIPGPMVSMSLTGLLNHRGVLGELYYKTLTAPILAQQFRLLPFAWLVLCATMASIPRRTWETAIADGLTAWQKLKIVVLPQALGRLTTTWILLMLLSLGELSCSMGVLPPGVTTTSMRLFEILHFGMRHQDSGLCGVLVVVGWIAAIVMRRL